MEVVVEGCGGLAWSLLVWVWEGDFDWIGYFEEDGGELPWISYLWLARLLYCRQSS